MNAKGEILGIEKVVEMFHGQEKKSPQEILQALFSGVEEHSRGQAQQDDRTAAVLRYLSR
jgi:serine phosphatase RsbU (regulator of sigma subunit)